MIRIGTCSWTEKTLIKSGEFYPNTVRTAEGRLKYYSQYFDTVEVDSTYYAIPDKRTVFLWTKRTPENFIFHVKVYGAMTGHSIDPKTLPKNIFDTLSEKDKSERFIFLKDKTILKNIFETFKDNILLLKKNNKLGLLIFQYPPWFHYNTHNLDYILECKESLNTLRIAVEFRHGSWLTEKASKTVFKFLRENEITYIIADEPQYDSFATIPFIPEITTNIAYFRFHGRNKENWLKKGIETSLRYSYLYSDEELKDFIPHIKSCEEKTKMTFAMFNNCHGGFAIRNALRLKDMMN
jgi:uncharacterized protein YecE (DUF72 family)